MEKRVFDTEAFEKFSTRKNLCALEVIPNEGKAELFFTDTGRCVGWAFTPAGGSRSCCLSPRYREIPVRERK